MCSPITFLWHNWARNSMSLVWSSDVLRRPIFHSFFDITWQFQIINGKWANLLWPSQNIWTLWIITTIESEIGRTFWFFLEQYEMELTIFFFFFCLLSGAHRPHCPKATKLTYVWCNLKKNLYHSKWCMNKNTKPVSASQFQQQKTKKWWFHFLKLPNY